MSLSQLSPQNVKQNFSFKLLYIRCELQAHSREDFLAWMDAIQQAQLHSNANSRCGAAEGGFVAESSGDEAWKSDSEKAMDVGEVTSLLKRIHNCFEDLQNHRAELDAVCNLALECSKSSKTPKEVAKIKANYNSLASNSVLFISSSYAIER